MITLVGLGPGDSGQISLAAANALKTASRLFLRTVRHPTVALLKEWNVPFEGMDSIYESEETFDLVYTKITQRILDEASLRDVTYAVPGHPLMGERTVSMILAKAQEKGIETQVVASPSYVDAIAVALKLDLAENVKLLDALEMPKTSPDPRMANLIYQVYDRHIASDVKLALMDWYPDEYQIAVVTAAGISDQQKVKWIPLYELDRDELDHLSTVFVPVVPSEIRRPDFQDFVDVIARLRAEDGCPWDRKQTHQTLKKCLVEETYEVIEAIEEEDDQHLTEELGDLMMQVLFHAQIAKEEGSFDIRDVIQGIVEKLIRRHPHVFGDIHVENAEEVLINWDKIKAKEKVNDTEKPASVLDGVPGELPALMRANKISKKAAKTGFDWDSADGVLDKIQEEFREFAEAADSGDTGQIEEEFGDVLFALVNLARHYHVDPEGALRDATNKFIRRFHFIEQEGLKMGKSVQDMDLSEMESLWEKSKKSGL